MSQLTTEVIGNILALSCILLIARNSLWNWPVGIVNCVFFIAIFYPARLYGDCLLQVVYIGLSLWGIYQWRFGNGGVRSRRAGFSSERPISRATNGEMAWYLAGFIVLGCVLGWGLDRITDSDVPYRDGATTSACLTATWALAYRKLENWWFWIGSNISFFFLYQHKGLYVTQWCQIVFLLLSIAGYVNWTRKLGPRAELAKA